MLLVPLTLPPFRLDVEVTLVALPVLDPPGAVPIWYLRFDIYRVYIFDPMPDFWGYFLALLVAVPAISLEENWPPPLPPGAEVTLVVDF